jgi:hypothetical protein
MLYERARRVFPGGVNSPARALKHLPSPLVAEGAEGVHELPQPRGGEEARSSGSPQAWRLL